MDIGTWVRCGLAGLAIGAAAWPAGTAAGTVSKCLGGDGQVVFTSGECPEGTRRSALYKAEPEPTATPPRATSPARTDQARRPQRRASAGGRRARPSAPDRCRAARAKRDATLERVGLGRTFDLLRKLDEDVRAACRSPARGTGRR